MKLKSIKELVSIFPELRLFKASGNDFLLIDSASKSEVLRGARITNSRFSTNFSIWLTPKVCFPSSDTIVYSNYQLVVEDSPQELTLNKDLINETQMFHKFKDAIENNLLPLNSVDCLSSLEDYLSSNSDRWLVSAFSKAQYGLLSFYNHNNNKALDLIKTIYASLNAHNPLTKDVEQFLILIEKNDSEEISNYFGNLRSLGDMRINKLLKK
ncbi:MULTISPECIES: hypothetical protein [Pseudoalteromonas]|uniref:hypothetical protein n=1 Tax=Pseudoalteromonas TaxID=53246 RepID=UPI000826E63B|nr:MULTISPECIES: hypothetical protein [Pseudoalteromonas]